MAEQAHSTEEHPAHGTAATAHGEGESMTTTSVPQPPFNRAEIAQFDADDVKAGSVIGKMLAMFFFYTVVVMTIVAWWTFRNAAH
jgi:hypothetical protein